MQMKLLRTTNEDFGAIDQRLIKFSISGRYWRKWEYNGRVNEVLLDFNIACGSVRIEVLNNILIEFGIPRKPDGLIQMCFNETYNAAR
jgi:hypothetical protein